MSETGFQVGRIKWDNNESLWLISKEKNQTITRRLALVRFLYSIEKRPYRKHILRKAIEMIECKKEGMVTINEE